MQCQFGIEVLMEEIADRLGLDPIEFKRNNWIKVGEPMHLARQLGEGREGFEQSMATSGMERCVQLGMQATDFKAKRRRYLKQGGGGDPQGDRHGCDDARERHRWIGHGRRHAEDER